MTEAFPLVTALMPQKSRENYRRLFRILRDKLEENGGVINPATWHFDFEIAAVEALRSVVCILAPFIAQRLSH